MIALRLIVWIAAISVFGLCSYAALRWVILDGGKSIDPFALYFLAKGIFCSLSLVLSLRVIEVLSRIARYSTPPDEEEE
ncbi:MAG TPA: hypothetical protein VMG10_05975 [Gemmataceae bacterium]|nr:hypothetical protein [Gemmataceae bacterium]